jgi:hypothetical protein
LDHLAVIGEGSIEITLGSEDYSTARIGGRELRIERNRLVVIGDRSVVILLPVIGGAAVFVGGSVFRVERDRLVVVGNGPVVVPLALVGKAAIVVGDGKRRIERNRRVEIGDGSVVVLLALVGAAAVVVGGGPVFSGLNDGLDDGGASADLEVGRSFARAPVPCLRKLRAGGAAKKFGSGESPDGECAIDCKPTDHGTPCVLPRGLPNH